MPVGEEENNDNTYDAGGDVADSDNEVSSSKPEHFGECFRKNFGICCLLKRVLNI